VVGVKKSVLFLIMTIFVFVFFTGCIKPNPASSITVTIDSPTSITVGSAANFTVKLSSSKLGGIGNLFAKDPVISKVTWKFTHQTDSSKNFQFTATSATTNYTFGSPNVFFTGTFVLSVSVEDKDGNSYQSKSTNNKTVEIKASTPSFLILPKDTGDHEISLSELKKNQIVKFVLSDLTSEGISNSQIQNYQIRWALSKWDEASSSYKEIPALVQEYRIYATSNSYQVPIPHTGKLALKISIKDIFGNVTSFERAKTFDVVFAIPEAPQLLEHDWTGDGKKYRLVFSKSADAYYYEIYRQAVSLSTERIQTSQIEEFIGRAFLTDAEKVVFDDPKPTKGWVVYSVYAIDGGGASAKTEFSINVANRKPGKAKLISPIGLVTSVPDPVAGLWAYWSEGEDVDPGDTVTYLVYVKEGSNFVLTNRTTSKSAAINYLFANGIVYSIRVDATDGISTTTGDVSTFWIIDGSVQPPRIEEVIPLYLKDPAYLSTRVTFSHINPYGAMTGILTRYVIQFSRYSTFPPADTFEGEVIAPGTHTLNIPKRYVKENEPLYARVRAIVSTNHILFQSNWSNVVRFYK